MTNEQIVSILENLDTDNNACFRMVYNLVNDSGTDIETELNCWYKEI